VERYDVVLPSGGRIDDHFARVALTPYKALIKVKDYMLGFRVLEAVNDCNRLGRIVLVGPKEVQDAFGIRVSNKLNDTGDLTKNIAMAIRDLKAMGDCTSRVAIITTDLPYIEAKHIQAFLDACPDTADICVPLISKDEYLDRFPSAAGTFFKLKDGDWTLGCIYLIKPDVFLRILPEVEKAVENRKSKMAMAKLFGGKFVWKYLTKSLTSAEAVQRAETLLSCRISLIKNGPAEFAYDVDDINSYEYALRDK
jgi:GTP:adenosylcobinamide-phosphate guanylyltransferase